MEKDNNIHLVKKVSKELGMTYKELGEAIGYSESNLRQAVSRNFLSSQLKKSLELILKIKYLEDELKKVNNVKKTLKEFLN